jgi:hypothetical protein
MAIPIPGPELTAKRHEIVDRHMTRENAHEFDGAIDAFHHPRYEIVATGEVWDGAGRMVCERTCNLLVNGQPLTAGEQIPFGSTIDARNGTITLISIGPTGQLQAASFTGAIFQVVQAPDGSTELVLQGGDFSVCKNTKVRRTAGLEAKPKPKPKKGKRTPPVAAKAKANTTVVRSLWGNGTGQFTTKGRYAAATVRGTVWHTSDQCDGTSVTARTGVVAVLDLVTGKTIILTAPATYLAHP